MRWQTLEVERDGPILRVWLARPERRNALNTAALEEIARFFTELQTDFETRVVILGGRGPSFCAGADRKDPPGSARLLSSSDATDRERRFQLNDVSVSRCLALGQCWRINHRAGHEHAQGENGFGENSDCAVPLRDSLTKPTPIGEPNFPSSHEYPPRA